MSQFPEPDLYKIANRIIDIIRRDEAIFPTDLNKGYLQAIYFGRPEADVSKSVKPYAWVALADTPIVSREVVGRGNPGPEKLEIQFLVRLIADESFTEDTQADLYNEVQKIVTVLRNNPRLNLDDDPLVSDIRCTYTPTYIHYAGNPLMAFTIIVEVEKFLE